MRIGGSTRGPTLPLTPALGREQGPTTASPARLASLVLGCLACLVHLTCLHWYRRAREHPMRGLEDTHGTTPVLPAPHQEILGHLVKHPRRFPTLLIMGRLVHSKGAQCMRDQSSQHPKGRVMVVHEVGSKEIPESSTSHTHSPERDIKGGIQPCAVC